MKDIINSCKKYWFMFLLSLLIAIQGIYGVAILTWMMSSYIESIILAILSATLFTTFIVTLPIDYVCYKLSKEFSSKVAWKFWVITFLIYYGILSAICLLVLFIMLN